MTAFTTSTVRKTLLLLTILGLAHSQTVCKDAVLPACTDHSTRVCDEAKNSLGANQCASDQDCIAGRTCSPFGWCQGVQSVKVVDCPTGSCQGVQKPTCSAHISRICDEAKNSRGPNRCASNADCIIGRSCSPFGYCQGTQSVNDVPCNPNHPSVCKSDVLPACSLHVSRLCDEAKNSLGANQCASDADCISGRTCSPFGWCQGTQDVAVLNC